MGFFDRLLGNDATPTTPPPSPRSSDEIAVERYRYLLRTAPPETIEQVHAEAFAKLTDDQRALIYKELSDTGETPRGTDAASLAQSATRSELRQPGSLERSFQGPSFGSMVGSSLLGTVAGYVIGSALVSAFMPMDFGGSPDAAADANPDAGADSASAAGPDASTDAGADFGGGDSGFGDFGGGDFGGGFDF
jgi:hypothetical protein